MNPADNPLHIHAQPGDVAPIALLVGDPARAERIASLLEGARCYNRNRGLLGFTGAHRGIALSVQTTGIGSPSAAIVVEELAALGVGTVVRLGTCGAIASRVAVLDIVIATGAVPLEGTTRQYVGDAPLPPIAHHDIVSALVRAASAGERHWHTGLLATQDAFYQEASRIADLDAFGVLATEMETSAIFTVAALRGLRAGSACLVLDRVQDRSTWASEQDQFDGIADLITLGLSAAVELGSAPPGVAG